MTTLLLIILTALCIGSFLNACIWRLPREISVNSPSRSFCTSCNYQLSWYDNIPVLSWVFLLGRCRKCKQSISGRYPLVEMLSALAAFACYLQFGVTPTSLIIYLLTASLIVITFIDLDFKIIPNLITFPGMIIGLAFGGVNEYFHVFTNPVTSGALDSLIGFLIGGGFFFVVGEAYYRITGREGIGGGDIKLLAMTGAILGWRSIPHTIFIGSFFGAIVGLLYMFIKGGGRQLEIPFGPWLALGVLSYIFFTDIPFFRF